MRKKFMTKGVSLTLAAATVISMTPSAAFAVTGDQVAADGTYTGSATVTSDEPDSWNDYGVDVSVSVSEGLISDITVTPGDAGTDSDGDPINNKPYQKKAVNGTSTEPGFLSLVGQSASQSTVEGWDAVSGATYYSNALKEALAAALEAADEAETEDTVDKTELETAIKEAEEKVESDYTAASWTTFSEALTKAKEVDENQDATAEDVATALSALKEATEGLEESTAFTETTYVYMNIPYDKFYEAEVNNDVAVDAYTSATKSKPRSWGLSAGSYHTDASAESINGAVYAVEVPAGTDLSAYTQITEDSSLDITVTMRGQETTTTLTGSQVLFESPDYSYYVIGTEAPASYKVLTVNEDGSFSFGKAIGDAETKEATAELSTDSNYGDYELDLDIDKTNIGYTEDETAEVNAVVINTTDGTSYGLRTMENIWRVNELAWCTGFTSEVHGCPTSSAHYESMMGKTIDSVTYYTSKGIYTFDIEDTYVPKKVSEDEAKVSVADAKAADGQTTVEATLPDGYTAVYSVNGLDEAKVEDGLLTYSKTAVPGKYTLSVSDSSKTYADLSASFILSTDTLPAKYDEESKSLIAAESADATEFENYLSGISSVSVDGKSYAASGRGSVTIINKDGSLNTEASPIAQNGTYELTVSATGYPDLTFTYEKAKEKEYVYAYAALSYSEYWSGEGVYANTDTSSSDQLDTNGEYDLGGFDTVSRATANHGLHRGSFQQNAVIYDTEGNTYTVSYWIDKTTAVLTDGSTIGFAGGTITLAGGSTKTMDHYEILGIKYVPVKVDADDYEAFKEAYTVVENGESLAGGFTEGALSNYSGLVAAVDENTNGLKEVTKNDDGSFSFGARQTGSGSGIEGAELQSIEATPVVQSSSSFGDFIRVDIKENFGELGSKMQTVVWNYYGDGDTVLASYGTKFAADNWMHKSMGIQLGLTDSARCQLPSGTDGTGKWTVTLYALGYADTTMEFNVTADDIHAATPVSDTSKLEAAIEAAKALDEADYTAESWSASGIENELKEAEEELALAAKGKTSQEAVDEATTHLNNAISELVQLDFVYAYAAISYSEYWSGEDVYANTDTSSSDQQDTNGEYDLGGFDTVSRATANHGLHRGSFQQNAVIYDTEGNTYTVSYWTDKTTAVLTDGSKISFAGGTITLADGSAKTMDHYEILGIKYVPVKVAADDYEAFKEAYTVVENGDSLAGGFTEGALSSYSDLVAAVDENTNGLKRAYKNEDGSFSFGARKSGSGSGIDGAELQSIEATPVVQSSSSFGDFIRVDIKENFGELGSKMQTVVWNYYGDGDTVLASYGTKFAADNWMHKSMGIQLGLTDSARCQLPSGTDGTGKWTVTLYALGYADTTMEFNVTADDIHAATPVSDTSKLEAAIEAAKALDEADYTAESWSASGIENELKEAEEELALAAKGKTSQEAVDEAATHLNNAISELVPVISEKNGFNKIDDEWVYYQDGKATTITDVVNGKIDGVSGWYNVVDGKLAKGVTVAHNSAGWWYIDENGKVDFSYTGLAANKYGTWYLENGKVNFSKTDVLKLGNSWYNIVGGKLTTGPTLGKNSSGWWYIDKNGKVDFSVTTLVQYYNVWYYVENGKLNWNYTGLCKYEGTWYYVQGGKLNWNYTGLCKYGNAWYYVQSGKLNWNYTGLCKYGSSWYYVQSGKLNWNYTGLTQYYGTWYYVEKGVLNWNYTGLVNHYGGWYYVEKGVLNWNYTGLVNHYGGWYYVEKGKINWNYTGFVKYNNSTWYVQKGSINFSYSGTVSGKKVVNGKVQ